MRVSLNWLKDYVNISLSVDDLADLLDQFFCLPLATRDGFLGRLETAINYGCRGFLRLCEEKVSGTVGKA